MSVCECAWGRRVIAGIQFIWQRLFHGAELGLVSDTDVLSLEEQDQRNSPRLEDSLVLC